MRRLLKSMLFIAVASVALAEEAAEAPTDEKADVAAPVQQGDGIDSPKTLSGMSILGNEEAPKALVIIPWKSSELGDDISLSDSLDDRARPVDKEVFERELRYYEIRSEDRDD
ncbi:MAG: hypothetical protein R3288_10220 [Woeseiaceae bacterium]|nr:hypothetical protein [Woeseiaceae bacterium]